MKTTTTKQTNANETLAKKIETAKQEAIRQAAIFANDERATFYFKFVSGGYNQVSCKPSELNSELEKIGNVDLKSVTLTEISYNWD